MSRPQRTTFKDCWRSILYRSDAVPFAQPTVSKLEGFTGN